MFAQKVKITFTQKQIDEHQKRFSYPISRKVSGQVQLLIGGAWTDVRVLTDKEYELHLKTLEYR